MKNLPGNAGNTRDADSILGGEYSPGVENGNQPQYSFFFFFFLIPIYFFHLFLLVGGQLLYKNIQATTAAQFQKINGPIKKWVK